MVRKESWMAMLAVGLVVGCAGAPANLPVCTAFNSPGAICGLMNPEDLAFLPKGEWIAVSQMAHLDAERDPSVAPTRPGSLIAVRAADAKRQALYPASVGWDLTSAAARAAKGEWGDPDCSEPPSLTFFQPHGLAVGKHASGAAMLAVVNHGGREAVELFEIESTDPPQIEWRGCVRMPEGVVANDVALFADGGFVVTKFMPPIDTIGVRAIWNVLKLMAGWDTGAVYRWNPGGEVVLVEGSEGSAPNGIAISADESEIFVAQWGGANVYRVPLTEESREAHRDAPQRTEKLEHHPDNLTWGRNGQLVAAGQAGSMTTILGCGKIEKGGCGLDYGVYEIDPETFEVKALFTGKGAASVALEVGYDIFVGSFSGDQIERVAVPR